MAKPPKAFDVWFVAANTVYKGVPYNVVADWVQQGRLAPDDMIRPAGTPVAWGKVAEDELLADYLPRPVAAKAVPATAGFEVTGADVLREALGRSGPRVDEEPAELPDPEPPPKKRAADDDDDVDMIPLIDVSMVLLVFFIIMRASGALAPVEVPEMRYAGQLTNDPEAITINVEKKDELNVFYSVRRGQQPPQLRHDQLPTPEQAITAVDELLADAQRPPEVRIACRKDLPRERVYELRRELEIRQRKNYINSVAATVIEAPKKN